MANAFLYPRKASVNRPAEDTGIGVRPYGGLRSVGEATIETNLQCHIQIDREGKTPSAGLPGDAAGQPTWRIIFPNMPIGTVKSRDIIVDDQGVRYQVYAAAWNPLVTSCLCLELTT